MENKSLPKQFITCPVCEGSGKAKSGLACPNCKGMGTGAFYQGRFLFWGTKLSLPIIELTHFRKKIHTLINFISYAITMLGLIGLGIWMFNTSQQYTDLEAFAFWREKSFLILFFWASLIALMFVIYRISEEERKSHKIKPMSYYDREKKLDLPSNWQELKSIENKFKIDVSGGFSSESLKIVEEAYLLADKLNHQFVSPLHLFLSSFNDKQVAAVFSRLDIDINQLMEKIKKYIGQLEQSQKAPSLSNMVKEIFVDAYIETSQLGQTKVTTKSFIIPIIENNQLINDILYEMEIDKNKIFNAILWFIINDQMMENYQIYKKKAKYKPGSNMDRAYTAVETKTLDHFGYDLTVAAKWGRLEYCVAREEEISEIFQNMESGSRGVILVGPPGAGKTMVVNGIAQMMVKEDVPEFLKDKRLVELDAARLISGATPSQAEGRMIAIIDEALHSGNIVLFIDNIENIIGITSGQEESLDLSEVVSSSLERANIYVIATATEENYKKYIEGKSLGNIMAKVGIDEPQDNQAIQIVESKIGFIEAKHKVYFSYNAIEEVIKLSSKYIHDKYLPDKAIKILEKVAVRTAKTKGEQALVGKDDIAAVISEMSGIPVTKITESEGEKLLGLENEMHKRMINQKEAVKAVAASLRRARTEIREGGRPIANFLFMGPTGVGKTELAKTVSEVYFGNEKYMIRLDMSEYQHEDSVNKMIGDPHSLGYLTEQVRQSPFSLVLLDEFEKAHPKIFNLFLQVMEDGRLTDGRGRTVDFSNAIIVATSNVGALFIQEQIKAGASVESIKENLINDHINQVLRPELINRFDGILVFTPLSMENIIEITKLMINKIAKSLEPKGLSLEYNEEGVKMLAEEGYDPKFGARPLRRVLQEKIQDEIANKILAGDLKRRDTIIINEFAQIKIKKAQEL